MYSIVVAWTTAAIALVLTGLAAPAHATPVLGMHEGAVNACDNTERWTHSHGTHVARPNYAATAVDMGTGGGSPWWRALNVNLIRWSPPWDIALPARRVIAQDPSARWARLHAAALRHERTCMDWWLNVALQDHQTVEIAFKPDYDYRDPRTNHVVTPDLATYRTAIEDFVAEYVKCPTASAGYCVPRSYGHGGPQAMAEVHIFTPWGEPDFEGVGPRGNYLPGSVPRASSEVYLDKGRNLFGGSQTCRKLSVRTCGPVLAAHMWTTASRACGSGCTVVAGDCTSGGCAYRVGGAGRGRSYLDVYRHSLGAARPAVWAVHPYTDTSDEEWCLRNTGSDYDPAHSVTQRFLASLPGATVWLDEISVWATDRSLHRSASQPTNVDGQPCGVNSTTRAPTYSPQVEAAAFQWLYAKLATLPGITTLVYFRAYPDNPGWDISPDAAPGSNEAALYDAIVARHG